MTDFNSAGYQTLREYIASSDGWDYVELRDDSNDQITRFSISGDSRAEWIEGSANPLELEVTVAGGDSDIPLATTIVGGALYATSSGGSALHEGAWEEGSDPIISVDADTVTVTYTVEVPELS